jgi:hypothetical protein
VGHNPGLEELLQDLTGELAQMPTAALARIVLDVKKWQALGPEWRAGGSSDLRGSAKDSFLCADLVPIKARLAPIHAAGDADALATSVQSGAVTDGVAPSCSCV